MIGVYSFYVLTLSLVSLVTLAFSILKKLVRMIKKIRSSTRTDTVVYELNKTNSLDMRSIEVPDVDKSSNPLTNSALPELRENLNIPYPVSNPWLFQKVAHAFKAFKLKSSN